VDKVHAAEGESISVTELPDGRVVLKTKDRWDGPIDRTYQSCAFFKDAIPVLRRELPEAHAAVLEGACTKAK
jgi:hypothetical protein